LFYFLLTVFFVLVKIGEPSVKNKSTKRSTLTKKHTHTKKTNQNKTKQNKTSEDSFNSFYSAKLHKKIQLNG